MPQISPENALSPKAEASSPSWIEGRLEQMEEVRLAGKLTESLEDIVNRLGYPDYETYLRSPLWQKIRERVMEHDLWVCQLCEEPGEEVHHRYYTKAVMRGDDGSLLVSLCAKCHHTVEFDEKGRERPTEKKQRILEGQDKVRREKAEAVHLEAFDQQTRDAAGGRCYWCKGDTEIPPPGDGKTYIIPTEQGEEMGVWMCSGCRSLLDHDKDYRPISSEEKLLILSRKPNVLYVRRKPSTSFRPGNGFYGLNAMQREGLRNEYEWNCANLHRKEHPTPQETLEFEEVRQRYERTKANGR